MTFRLAMFAVSAILAGCSKTVPHPSDSSASATASGVTVVATAKASGSLATTDAAVKNFTRPKRVACAPRAKSSSDSTKLPLPEVDHFNHEVTGECKRDSDCKKKPNGLCIQIPGGRPIIPARNECRYDECFKDSDCNGFMCACGGEAGRNACVAGDCTSNEDCGTNVACKGNPSLSGYVLGRHCETPRDLCKSASDCPGGSWNARCFFENTRARWECGPFQAPPPG